jgi:hypothetical protein
MGYLERDDRKTNLNDQSEFYEDDSMYDEIYGTDGFGERVDSGGSQDEAMKLGPDEAENTTPHSPAPANQVEEGFGEAINPISNPHIDDQLDDQHLSTEAEAEYNSGPKDENLMDKAKTKMDEWTNEDQPE